LAKMCRLHMSRNHEIANLLFEVAEGLQAAGERGFRVMAYERAAQRVARMPEDVEVLCEMGHLRDIEGVGESISAKVRSICGRERLAICARCVADPAAR
jgi:DNA polymerase (family 10)